MSSEIEYYDQLSRIMYRTRGCRFGAASALETKQRWSVGTVAFLSIYLLSWSIILLAYPEAFNSTHTAFYSAVSATASAALLVVSLMDYAFDRTVKAEKLHQNALAISNLMRDLERQLASASPDVIEMKKIAVEYERCISETQVNHTSQDFTRWNYTAAKPNGILTSIWYPVRRLIFNFWFYFSSMFMYIALLAAILVPTIWYTLRFVVPATLWK